MACRFEVGDQVILSDPRARGWTHRSDFVKGLQGTVKAIAQPERNGGGYTIKVEIPEYTTGWFFYESELDFVPCPLEVDIESLL